MYKLLTFRRWSDETKHARFFFVSFAVLLLELSIENFFIFVRPALLVANSLPWLPNSCQRPLSPSEAEWCLLPHALHAEAFPTALLGV